MEVKVLWFVKIYRFWRRDWLCTFLNNQRTFTSLRKSYYLLTFFLILYKEDIKLTNMLWKNVPTLRKIYQDPQELTSKRKIIRKVKVSDKHKKVKVCDDLNLKVSKIFIFYFNKFFKFIFNLIILYCNRKKYWILKSVNLFWKNERLEFVHWRNFPTLAMNKFFVLKCFNYQSIYCTSS